MIYVNIHGIYINCRIPWIINLLLSGVPARDLSGAR